MASQGMTALANITLGTAQATITFGSIPATFRDLRLVASMANTVGNGALLTQVNADTGANYNWVRMYGDGTTAASSSSTGATNATVGNFGTGQSNSVIDFLDYGATDKYKTWTSRTNDAGYIVSNYCSRWTSTAAITSIVIYPAGNSFAAGSTFSLFGVSA